MTPAIAGLLADLVLVLYAGWVAFVVVGLALVWLGHALGDTLFGLFVLYTAWRFPIRR